MKSQSLRTPFASRPPAAGQGREIAPGLFHVAGAPIDRIASDAIVAVAYVRDEAWRLPFWLAYHRWLGIDRFIMIDNASADHTAELLAGQADVTLVSAPGRFEWYAWTNDIIRLCPPEGWTLAIDADELFVAPPWRQGGLRHTVQALDAEGAEAAFALMVDCHGQTLRAPTIGVPAVPWQRAPWFDSGPYATWWWWLRYPSLFYSGARERICWPSWKYWRYVTGPARSLVRKVGHPLGLVDPPNVLKVPLHRSRSRGATVHDVGCLHWAKSYFCLLHYKLDIDLPQKVQCALAERQHWRGSVEYEVYARMLQDATLDLRSVESRRFTGLASLVDAEVCHYNPGFLSRVRAGGPVDSPLARVETEIGHFGDRYLTDTIPAAAFA